MSDKLKPCPFCGGMNLYYAAGRFYAVECSDCGAKVVGAFRTEEEAAEAWNRRVQPEFEYFELRAIHTVFTSPSPSRRYTDGYNTIVDKCEQALEGVRYDAGNI